METLIKKALSETYSIYQHSGHSRSEFYDMTLSVIALLIFLGQYDKVTSHQHERDVFLLFNRAKEEFRKENFEMALKYLEETNGHSWSGLLQLDPILIKDISNKNWQIILQSWRFIFINDSLKENPFLPYLIFDNLEQSIALQERNDNIHIVPKALAEVMTNYVSDSYAQTLYDPFARSGNLLMEALQELPAIKKISGFTPMKLAWKLTKLRLLFSIKESETELDIQRDYDQRISSFSDEKYDVIISNPPFGGQLINLQPDVSADWHDLVQKSNRPDVFYLCHILSRLADGGRAALLLPGIFLSGNIVIKELIKRIIREHMLDAVITLPQGLFAHTGIASVLICINKKRDAEQRILLADASNQADKSGKQSILKSEKILYWLKRLKLPDPQIDDKEDVLVTMVTEEEIAAKDYNLYQPAYKQKKNFIREREFSEKLKKEYENIEQKLMEITAEIKIFLSEK